MEGISCTSFPKFAFLGRHCNRVITHVLFNLFTLLDHDFPLNFSHSQKIGGLLYIY